MDKFFLFLVLVGAGIFAYISYADNQEAVALTDKLKVSLTQYQGSLVELQNGKTAKVDNVVLRPRKQTDGSWMWQKEGRTSLDSPHGGR